ncbi:hypothetical protein AMIS_29870 [Actinoplanes missouriensis 431]|uniref:Uncharacterized protein n=1 Tax=Actinoplanes missouriensis (strain ATCC 14538 / DSM 43046 / CBS 188.64 / JCM 3121 / NBRC 102363 / NCIMB 12654 / NRRL B-3342 / UNCC 431) TaxID=512565 RepID=I0H5C0_ACTM4|nr:hypothetical protein [Actinoplanes missouriensis]BAL88207.1 hypothetical protein AMIS_29870 [Actinoplanes missouriensis 431]
MKPPRIACKICGQDWLVPYRSLLDGSRFLLCPECDSVWLPEDDPAERTEHSLTTVFEGYAFMPGQVDWDLIEPDPDQPERR